MESSENVDWSYARREAVVARLNGREVNLDQLTDSDLNQLYSNIRKVRHSRTSSSIVGSDRPESRMSYLDSVTEDDDGDDTSADGESRRASQLRRPYSTATWTTDLTSLADSTFTLHNLPDLEEKGFTLDETPSRSALTPASISSSTAEDDALREKRAMEDKVKKLEMQMAVQRRRLARIRAAATNGGSPASEQDSWLDEWPRLTPEEEGVARAVVAVWKRQRKVRMAEDALSQAVLLKEANVMSRELKKGVTFQFGILDQSPPVSAQDVLDSFEELAATDDDALVNGAKPCVAVKVLDRRHQAVKFWSLSKLQSRVLQMREQYRWLDKPEYQQHFISHDPFSDSASPPGGFSHIAGASVSLAPLKRRLCSEQVIDLFSPYIADPIGTCRVTLDPVSPTRRRSVAVADAELVVDLCVDQITGLDDSEFAAVHLQTSLKLLFGTAGGDDEVAVGETVPLADGSSAEINLRHRFKLSDTDIANSRHQLGSISVFAQPRLSHFDKIERWDEAREGPRMDAVSVRNDPAHIDVTRRPETELIGIQQHDVIAHVEIRELGEKGEYDATQVVSGNKLDRGAFFLRQGLQRRLVINLSHNSGRELRWKRIAKVTLGNVRLLDHRNLVHAGTSTGNVELRPASIERPEYTQDGMSLLAFAGVWDSSAHDSAYLNKPTSSGSRALLELAFEVEVADCVAPIGFTFDIAVTVAGRDSRPPSRFTNLFTSNRLASRIAAVFCVTLQPYETRKAADIWRVDTSETYVRGEEILGGWRPRGLSLIRDHEVTQRSICKSADVGATKAILAATTLAEHVASSLDDNVLLRRSVDMWTRRFGIQQDVRDRTDILDLAIVLTRHLATACDGPPDRSRFGRVEVPRPTANPLAEERLCSSHPSFVSRVPSLPHFTPTDLAFPL